MDRERQPGDATRVQITRAVFDGLEFIRRSGATNMLDRPMVLQLAREWDFPETADWIEGVDTATYARLIFQGPEVIEEESLDEKLDRLDRAYDEDRREFWEGPASLPDTALEEAEVTESEADDIDVTAMAMDRVRATMPDLLSTLGKHAILTIADTYETQRMGVLVDPSRNDLINTERDALIRQLGQASAFWLQLDQAMAEIERGIGSLQYLIDPENN